MATSVDWRAARALARAVEDAPGGAITRGHAWQVMRAWGVPRGEARDLLMVAWKRGMVDFAAGYVVAPARRRLLSQHARYS